MKPKRTLSERLTTRYQLVIRNEENLAERSTFFFSYGALLAVLLAALLLFFVLGIMLSKTVLARWFDPKYAQVQMERSVRDMALQIDSLAIESDRRGEFIKNMRYALGADTASGAGYARDTLEGRDLPAVAIGNMELTPLDSQFRRDFERSEISLLDFTRGKYRRLQTLTFIPPVNGFVSGRYNPAQGLNGVRITTQVGEPVKAVARGMVILSTFTPDAGYVLAVQHADNLISIYRYNAEVLKKEGSFVAAGAALALAGSGKDDKLPWVYLELWYDGRLLNPEEFIIF